MKKDSRINALISAVRVFTITIILCKDVITEVFLKEVILNSAKVAL